MSSYDLPMCVAQATVISLIFVLTAHFAPKKACSSDMDYEEHESMTTSKTAIKATIGILVFTFLTSPHILTCKSLWWVT